MQASINTAAIIRTRQRPQILYSNEGLGQGKTEGSYNHLLMQLNVCYI